MAISVSVHAVVRPVRDLQLTSASAARISAALGVVVLRSNEPAAARGVGNRYPAEDMHCDHWAIVSCAGDVCCDRPNESTFSSSTSEKSDPGPFSASAVLASPRQPPDGIRTPRYDPASWADGCGVPAPAANPVSTRDSSGPRLGGRYLAALAAAMACGLSGGR